MWEGCGGCLTVKNQWELLTGDDGVGFLSQLAFNPITIVGTEIGWTVKSQCKIILCYVADTSRTGWKEFLWINWNNEDTQLLQHRKIKSVNHPPDAIGAVKIFP